jgi:transposase
MAGMPDKPVVEWIRKKYMDLSGSLEERGRRVWAAVESRSLGWGGVAAVSAATGIAESTIRRGLIELELGCSLPEGYQRRPGGGRKAVQEHDAKLVHILNRLVEPATLGDPQSPLRWTTKSTRNLAVELTRQGHPVGPSTVRKLLHGLGYSLQANRKTREGKDHPDRDKQFRYLNRRVKSQLQSAQPSISVDTKKKEVLGNLKNPGQTWRPKKSPREVNTHDFPDKEKGKAVPYGVYDIGSNEAWVSVGISSDTAEFAVAAIRQWWKRMGRKRYSTASRLLITADSGGSNSSRNRLWKLKLQEFADEIDKSIEVCHFPPGTSKWNKIEHRVFCHITNTWRGQPLETHQVVVDLIGSTRTSTGLVVKATLDGGLYQKGRKVTDAEMESLNIIPARFHGEWNYVISPRKT